MQLSVQDIQLIKSYFAEQPVLRAYIFGSYARNNADTDSDVDILVDLDYNTPIGLGFVQMQLDLQEKLHKKIDLVSSKAVSKFILPFIEKDKTLIYER
jgi:predicted nucleotidyltransferase